jgi:hypothetical protein
MNRPNTISPSASGLTPQQIIQTYSSDVWEAFTEEWAEGFDPPYAQIVRIAGPGDKGRDVVAHVTDPALGDGEWDAYQCKHYDHALRPSDVYAELGKLCVYTLDGSFTKPRRYRFVAPFGVGTKLYDLLRNPERLKAELIANWDGYCRRQIAEKGDHPLEGTLKEYVLKFDFSIVWFLTPAEILTQHERTKYWHRRFKLDAPTRPAKGPVPDDVQPQELGYVRCLLDAYADHVRRPMPTVAELQAEPRLARHFRRSREYFFSAEALGRFSRDHFEPDAFETVKRHIYDGVIDAVEETHKDGFARVQKVTELAVSVELPELELKPYLEPSDRKGVCHHLANDGKVMWCSNAESQS